MQRDRHPLVSGQLHRMLVAAGTATIMVVVGAVVWWTVIAADTTRLVVVDMPSETVLYMREVAVGEQFELRHRHSVTERMVYETFSVHDVSTLAIEQLRFDRHGANLPTGPERRADGSWTTYTEVGSSYQVDHHGHIVGVVPLVVGRRAIDHHLRFSDGEVVHLLDITTEWSQVELRARARLPWVRSLWPTRDGSR